MISLTPKPGSRLGRFHLVIRLLFAVSALSAFASENKKPFDIGPGSASETLKVFARQAGSEIVFSGESVGAVSTNRVKGEFTAREAIDAMLSNTGLVATEDTKTGAFAVRKGPSVPNAPRAVQKSGSRPDETKNTDEVLQLEKFEVTAIGQNYVNQDAIQAKRSYAQIYDSISQDDIGKLPDVNIADSFRRIAGISAVNDEDEGRFVLARGIHPSLNHVTFEGMAVATHDAFGGGGRNVNLETIPASSVRRLEAFKTFTPNMDGGSIGAYLNLTTRSASDRKGVYAVAGASIGYYTQRDVPGRSHPPSTRAQLAYGQNFGANDRFGLMISVEDFRKSRDQVKIIQDGYSYFNAAGASTGTPLNGNGYAAPNQFRWYVYNNDLSRTGINAKFEFNPSSRFRSYVSFYRFRQQDDEDRHGHQIVSLTGMSGQTATRGTYASGRSEVSFTHNDIRRKLDGAHYHAEFTPGSVHKVTVDAAYSETRYLNSTPFIGFRTPANALLGLTYDSSALIQTYRFNNGGAAAFLGNPTNYALDNYNHRELKTEEYVQNHRITYGYNRQGEQGPWGFEMGADFKRLDRRVNIDRYNWANTSFRLSSASRTLAYTPPGGAEPFLFLDDVGFGGLFKGGTGTGFTLAQPSSFEQSAEGDFKYIEEITATYLMGTYQTKRFRAIGGLRYEDVQATAKTFRRLVAPVPDQFVPIDVPTGYDNLLPSGTASYELTTRLWLRAGVSRSVGRPDPSDISTLERVSADGLTITRGNPGLKPREANNYGSSGKFRHLSENRSARSARKCHRRWSDS